MGSIHWMTFAILIASCQLGSSKVPPTDRIEDCRGKAADVAFVLDASNSIWDVDFKRQLLFVNQVVDLFHIGNRNQKVSVITYSDHPQLQFPFYAYNIKSDVKAAVSNIRQTGGQDTNTDEALAYLRQYSFTSDQGARLTYWVNRIGIVITDGDSRNGTATRIEAQRAKDSGIHLFAIGVGTNVRNEELELIASKPTEYYTFRVNDFKSMDTIKNFLAIKTCAATNPPTTKRTTTTTTTTKPTTTTTTTTTTKAPTNKTPTTPKESFEFVNPLMSPRLRGPFSRTESDSNSRDVSHAITLNHKGNDKPQNNFRNIFDDSSHHPNPHFDVLKRQPHDHVDVHESDESMSNFIEERHKSNSDNDGSGNDVDLLYLNGPGSDNHLSNLGKGDAEFHKQDFLVTPSNGNHIHEPFIRQEELNKTKDHDDWNIIPNPQDSNPWEDEFSGKDVDENGQHLYDPSAYHDNDNDPYGYLSSQQFDVNMDKTPRKINCDNVDFWGTDDNNRPVYYLVAKDAPYFQSHRPRFFYHVILVDPLSSTQYMRNSRKDFWGYDDRGEPIGMRLHESRSDASHEAEGLASWPGPVYEMLSGPCLPAPPTQPHRHNQNHENHKSTNSLFLRVVEKNRSSEDESKTEGSNNFINSYLHDHGHNSGNVKLLDKLGKAGFWSNPTHPSEEPVWHQFVCPGVYVRADNKTGLPLDPLNVPSRINLLPPLHGDPRRGCWTKRKRHSPQGLEGRHGSNNPFAHERHGMHEPANNLHKVSENYVPVNKSGNDDEYEFVWVEYTAPGRFDPIDKRPEVTFVENNNHDGEGFIPNHGNSISENSFHAQKFGGKPKLWSVLEDGSLRCLMPDSMKLQGPQHSNHGRGSSNGHVLTNDLRELSLPSFKPETVAIKDGDIVAELPNGTHSVIGCTIGSTHMIGRWINRNAALAIVESDKHHLHDGSLRYFFGYPVEENNFFNLKVYGKVGNGQSSFNNFANTKEGIIKDWKPSIPLKIKTCQPVLPLDVVVGVDVRSRSGKRRRRTWQIVKDFVSGLDMRKNKVSVRFAHDYVAADGYGSPFQNELHHGHHETFSNDVHLRRWKRSGVYTEKKDLLGKINEMESMCGTSPLIRTMANMLKKDGFGLSQEDLSDICNKSAIINSQRNIEGSRARKIAILFVDGVIEDIEESLEIVAEMTEKLSFELFVIGIGKTARPEQLMSLASSNGASVNYFNFDSNVHDPRYLKQLELFFLHKDPQRTNIESPATLKKAKNSSKPQYRHEISKILNRLCENR